jgi:hypothetical protein
VGMSQMPLMLLRRSYANEARRNISSFLSMFLESSLSSFTATPEQHTLSINPAPCQFPLACSHELSRYWIPRKDFTSNASFADDKPISGIQSSTAKLTAGNKTVDSLLVPESFSHELAGLVKIDFKALDQWLEEMRCVKMAPVTSRVIEAGLTNSLLMTARLCTILKV